jgi:hypothetical protein
LFIFIENVLTLLYAIRTGLVEVPPFHAMLVQKNCTFFRCQVIYDIMWGWYMRKWWNRKWLVHTYKTQSWHTNPNTRSKHTQLIYIKRSNSTISTYTIHWHRRFRKHEWKLKNSELTICGLVTARPKCGIWDVKSDVKHHSQYKNSKMTSCWLVSWLVAAKQNTGTKWTKNKHDVIQDVKQNISHNKRICILSHLSNILETYLLVYRTSIITYYTANRTLWFRWYFHFDYTTIIST